MTIRAVAFTMFCLAAVACAEVPQRYVAVAQADGDNHITIRAEGGRLWWSHRPWSEPHELWKLPSNGPVHDLAVRAVASSSGPRFEITFELNGEPWRGDVILDESSMLDTESAFLRGTDRLADGSMLVSELAHSGR